MSYCYSTQAFLAWCFNHYFYAGLHFAYVATAFHTYRFSNPPSSNPLDKYRSLFEAWKDNDENHSSIGQARLKIRSGVEANLGLGVIDPHTAQRLKQICDRVHVLFFYPLVYRVDINRILPHRLNVAG